MKFDELEISDYSIGGSELMGCTFREFPIEGVFITDYDLELDIPCDDRDIYYLFHIGDKKSQHWRFMISRQFLEQVQDNIIIEHIKEIIDKFQRSSDRTG